MKTGKSLTLWVCLFISLPAISQMTPAQPGYLYVQSAGSGTLKPISGQTDVYTLTLRNVPASIAYFSDRPFRVAGSQPMTDFIARWTSDANGFKTVPPNAALQLAGESREMLVVELMTPRYDAAKRTATYRARLLKRHGSAKAMFFPEARRAKSGGARVPATFKEAFLFIDDGSDEREDTTIYMAVVNHEEQYSIWPADRELPAGWTDAGMRGLKPEVLAWIEEVWTDMRPKSTRNP